MPSQGETTIYREPWHDGKLAGPAQPAVRLPFAFRQGFSRNAYDFSVQSVAAPFGLTDASIEPSPVARASNAGYN